ncbi:hypothetical protein Acr_11g0010340 [Actinidia rufa]|uniref:Transmembrane protein n=1 Tax=Actinidia rufa TaxID=165716 RepID=A0A7J0FDJ2_9ERIC|nr:hypothetical protein Acr_11g0010340 [Actinidia rufa]
MLSMSQSRRGDFQRNPHHAGYLSSPDELPSNVAIWSSFDTIILPICELGLGTDARVPNNNPGLCGSPLRGCRGSSGMSLGAIAGIIIGLLTGTVVLASLLIGYVQGKKRKNRENDEELEEEGEEDENGSNCSGGGDGKLILFHEKINVAVVVKRG